MSQDDLTHRIERVEERLARLEAHLQLGGPPASRAVPEPERPRPPRPAAAPTPPPPAPPPAKNERLAEPRPATGTPETLVAALLADRRAAATPAAPLEPPAPPEHAPPPAHAEPAPPAPAPAPSPESVVRRVDPRPRNAQDATDRPSTRLEFLVGAKWMAWTGVLVVLLGGGFFFQHAAAVGWLPPAVRCLIGAAFGGLLLLGGEIALRRIGRLASVGLFGAGLSILQLVSWAAFGRYHLMSELPSFVCMGAVALLGFGLTVHTRFLTTGVLSILGGYAAVPLLLTGWPHHLAMMVWLTLMLAISLGLSAVDPRHFRPLRFVAFGAHLLIALVWMLAAGQANWAMAVIFPSLWWSMVLAESTIAAMRGQSPAGNIVATLLATAAYVTAGTWILHTAAPAGFDWLGAFTAAVAVLGAAVALHFGPGLDGLRGRLRTAMDKLALALWAQSGVLITVAAALQLDGWGESIGWLALGLAAVEIGRRLPSRGVGIFGLVVGALAVIRIAFVDSFSTALEAPLFASPLPAVPITGWGLLAALAVAATLVAARRLGCPARGAGHPFRPWPTLAVVLTLLGAMGWCALTSLELDRVAVTWAWLLAAAALLALERFGRSLRYFEIGLFLLLAAGARWFLLDAALPRLSPGWSAEASTPLFNATMAAAVAIAAAGTWAFRIASRRRREGTLEPRLDTRNSQLVFAAVSVFMLVALSFQVDHAVTLAGRGAAWSAGHVRQLLLTLLWAGGGFAMGFLGLRPERRPGGAGDPAPMCRILPDAGALILIGAGLKWLACDTLMFRAQLAREQLGAFLPFANLELFAGVLIAIAMTVLVRRRDRAGCPPGEGRAWWPVVGGGMVLWGLSLEIDRLFGLIEATGAAGAWGPFQVRALWWTALWAAGGAIMLGLGRRLRLPDPRPLVSSGWILLLGTALAWLSVETLAWRLAGPPAQVMPVVNLQFAVGAGLLALLAAGARLRAPAGLREPEPARSEMLFGAGLAGALILWLGTLEIDRALAGSPMAVQTGLSVYWCAYAVALVVAGFARRLAVLRYVGLALLSLTVVKVLVIDLSQIDRIWRVASFVISGLLLLGTSVLYSKLAPRLLAAH